MTLPAGLLLAAALAPVPDFTLPDARGGTVRLSAYAAGLPVAVVAVSVDCPLAGRNAPRLKELAARLAPVGVKLLVLAADPTDTPDAVAAFAARHGLDFPCVSDSDGSVVASLGVTRSPQAVVLDGGRRVRYRGRIDDQYEAGGRAKAAPTREDLFEAACEAAGGKPVSVPFTPTTGCVLGTRKATETAAVTFSRDVAPILQSHCAVCHRPGEAAPFPLLTFADAQRRAATLAEVVADGRMPPWHAAPGTVKFHNDRSLTAEQKRTLQLWVKAGCPEGNPADLPPPVTYPEGWAMGPPDAVYAIPEPFRVPADGVIEYQHFRVDPGLTADAWVSALEVRPGNRRVVHHCSVFLQPPSVTNAKEFYETGTLGSVNLIAWTPGSGPTTFPPGMAKRIPAGWTLHFVVHYTPVGTPQEDRTELGVRFMDPRDVKREVATKLLFDQELSIPPHAARHAVAKEWRAERDVLLMAMLPHMHLRGKSFRYEADYPDGRRETLLDVPAYDFDWQHRYELAEPKRLPAGTVVRCSAVYDNSASNPFNPDPAATVKAGEQSWDEMFNGYFDIALADQDIAVEVAADRTRKRWFGGLTAGFVLLAVAWARRKA